MDFFMEMGMDEDTVLPTSSSSIIIFVIRPGAKGGSSMVANGI